MTDKKIAVLVPCYNEAQTIAKVVADFKREIPQAEIYVYDNNSKDATFAIAKEAGAIVRKESRQGKGNVVRSMLRDIEADFYVLIDGDDTYPAESVQALLQEAELGADVVVGDRLSNGTYTRENKRDFHTFGNGLVLFLINHLYDVKLKDIMSGYRVFSRRFVKTYPALCEGFQLETDMTIFALSRKLKIQEVPIIYRDRPAGSESKLNTFSDGFRVLTTIFNLYRYFYPLRYFSLVAAIFFLVGVSFGIPVVVEFIETRFVSKVPSAILASGLMVLAIISFSNGLILDSINKSDQEEFERHLKKR
ncbi:MAG: glycosyltransferase family 2 protein [Candidatus Moranbacteria bacterium]|nr:glycosyltransferase family 2 protein [Candidatus Moranbacteria bacterium]